jgi:hypothetical protein
MNAGLGQRGSGASAGLKRLVAWGAAVQTARVVRRLRRADGAVAAQEQAWRRLCRGLAASEFGRNQGLLAHGRYEDFRTRLPLHDYEALAPAIERMKRGEADVLWPGRCAYYAVSSGTTAGRTKFLPVNREMVAHFRRAGLDSLCFYARRAGHTRVFRGRHLFLGGSTTLTPLAEAVPFQAWSGDLSGITAVNLPRWVEEFLYEPGREISQVADWPAKIRAIAARTARQDITLVAGIPSWLLILAAEVRAQTGQWPLRSVWPNLECLVHGGVPLAPFETELRADFGPGVAFHEVYPASEGFIAAQDDEPAAGLRLLADAGIFYEFLPLEHYDPARLAELGGAAVPLGGVRPGIDYVLIMTTPAGLCRYVLGDVVRFTSTAPARLVYVGRTRLQLSAFGEHVIEKELTDAIAAVARARQARVANFHVAPRFFDAAAGEHRGRHEWWIEWKTGPGISAEDCARDLDTELQVRNDDYQAKRQGGGLAAPVVRPLPDGTFERWLRSRGKWGGQNKVPRCRSDRAVADELEKFVG